MRVYQMVNQPENPSKNPYVYTLMTGIREYDESFEWGAGVDVFWKEEVLTYDIIHIQWPSTVIEKNSERKLADLYRNRIIDLKAQGKKIVATCHNFVPHYNNNADYCKAYEYTYELADVVLHLGTYSYQLFKHKYPQARHELLYHHILDTKYQTATREVSIEKLKLNPDKKYILCFGAVRDNEERYLIDLVTKHYKQSGIEVLAPSYMKIRKRRNFFLMSKEWLICRVKEIMSPGLHIYGWFVKDDLLPYFFGASDLVLIHRKKILNSGNLPLGLMMGKVVVGPNVGNVGDIIKEIGNPVFDIDSEESLYQAIDKGLELSRNGKGFANSEYAKKNLSTFQISQKLYSIYKSLIQ